MYPLSDPNGPPTAFPLFRPSVLWVSLPGPTGGALRCPGRMASGTKHQPLSAALLHCCCTAEPVFDTCYKTLINSTKQETDCISFWWKGTVPLDVKQRSHPDENQRQRSACHPQRVFQSLDCVTTVPDALIWAVPLPTRASLFLLSSSPARNCSNDSHAN